MIKQYSFNYATYEAYATFAVDTELFTAEKAKTTLDFFTWYYDKDADPVDEVLKKYAIEAIKIATFNNYNIRGTIKEFENSEGFCKVDGIEGIVLVSVTEYEFDDRDLSVEVMELKKLPNPIKDDQFL